MTVIDFNQSSLEIERKRLDKAFKSSDWDSVRKIDSDLIQSLNRAAESPATDKRVLLAELEKIVQCYREGIERSSGLVPMDVSQDSAD